ncbi:MAG: UDP-3-O-(3-hydroxymyristoyl)glucosamine N-acyltransferase [Pseudomonadota bacterium]
MTLTVATLAEALRADAIGDTSLAIARPAPPDQAGPDDLAVAMEAKYAKALAGCRARAALLWPGADHVALGFEAAIFAPRPRVALSHLTARFAQETWPAPGVHPLTDIDPEAVLGEDVAIGPFVRIAAGARIGAGARISAHCSVGAGASLGPGACLHEGVRIGAGVTIGARFRAHAGAVIGSDGFSFVTPERGAVEAARSGGDAQSVAQTPGYLRIASLAAVTLGDDVEVGANTCIDRGTLADTQIGAGTKIDNLVQIGHNVRIGKTCLICGQVGIAGSVEIGDRVVLGGQSGVADHVKIGSDVLVAAQSGVASNIQGQAVVMGSPAIARDKATLMFMLSRRLPEIYDKVAALQKAVSNLGSSR